MVFRTVKAITIPEGIVTKIMSGSTLLWKKTAYKNLIETATTDPGGTEIYNGTGYKDDYRWSSSIKKESAALGARISGWIPFVSGATYRIKYFCMSKQGGYTSGGYIIKYNNGTITTTTIGRDNADYDAATDTFTWSETSTSIQYFRISAFKCDQQPIITMNEEIPE